LQLVRGINNECRATFDFTQRIWPQHKRNKFSIGNSEMENSRNASWENETKETKTELEKSTVKKNMSIFGK